MTLTIGILNNAQPATQIHRPCGHCSRVPPSAARAALFAPSHGTRDSLTHLSTIGTIEGARSVPGSSAQRRLPTLYTCSSAWIARSSEGAACARAASVLMALRGAAPGGPRIEPHTHTAPVARGHRRRLLRPRAMPQGECRARGPQRHLPAPSPPPDPIPSPTRWGGAPRQPRAEARPRPRRAMAACSAATARP